MRHSSCFCFCLCTAVLANNDITPVRMVVYRNDSMELLEIMFDGRAFHSLAVVGKKLFPNVFDVSNLKKLAVMFT